jgi:hypothetical protein
MVNITHLSPPFDLLYHACRQLIRYSSGQADKVFTFNLINVASSTTINNAASSQAIDALYWLIHAWRTS